MEPPRSTAGNGGPKPSDATRTAVLSSPPKRRLLLKLAFSLLSLMVVLGVAEIGLRFLTPTQLGFRYIDGWFSHPREYMADWARNQLGCHDVDHGPKPRDVRRVVLLGDSYVNASPMPIPRIPGQRLEHHLNARSDQAYEVISFGGGGWGQREELAVLREHGLAARPDVVITLFLSLNDVSDNSATLKHQDRQQRKDLKRRRPQQMLIRAGEMPLLFFRSSVLNQLISHRLAHLLRDKTVGAIPLPYFVYARHEDEPWRQAWQDTEELLLLTKQVAASAGARYVVVTASTPHGVWGAQEGLEQLMSAYPGMRELQWDLDKPDQRIERFCEANDIPFLALEPLFRIETVEKGKRLHFGYDGHWNAEGNDLAAQYIADFLLSLEGPPEPSGP